MKKITFWRNLIVLVALLIGSGSAMGQYAGTGTFSEITTLEQIESGSYYVFYGINSSYNGALKNTISSGRMGNESVTVAGTSITNPPVSAVWLVTGNSVDGYKLYNESAAKYCEITANTTSGFAFNATSSHTYTASLNGAKGFFFMSRHASAGSRGVSIYQSDWRPYAAAGAYTLKLYKMVVETNPTVASTPTFTPSTGTYYSTQNVTISTETEGATIYYTTDGSDPDNTDTEYTTPIAVSATTTVKAIAYKTDMDPSAIASATYTFPTEVANIAALRAGTPGSTVYKLTGEAVMTLKSSNNNVKYIQDATGGILIYDASGIITTAYNINDGITGITGTLSLFNGMLQFIPVTDPGAATSINNTVTPIEATLTNYGNYPGQLVKITGLTIAETGSFAASTNYTLSDGTNSGVLRTAYSDLPYIGSAIPTVPQDIVGVVLIYNPTTQLVPRTAADFSNTVFESPTILVTENEVPAMSAYVEASDSETITVNGGNLTENITLALSGTDAAHFRLSTSTLTQTDGSVLDASVTIYYEPTAAGSHTAKLTLSSAGATDVTRTLSGTATWAPLDAPVATAAAPVSQTAFTANWNAVAGATEYELSVSKRESGGSSETLNQEFTWAANGTGGNDGLWSGTIAGATTGLADHLVGWTITAGYKGFNCIKMGSGSTQGVLQTPALALTADATLTFRAGAWDGSSEQTELLLEISGGGALSQSSVQMVKAAFTNYTVNITGGTLSTKISFKGKLANNSRFFLDDVIVTQGGEVNTPIVGSPFTVVGTSKSFSGLNDGGTFVYTVKAKNANVTSAASNEIEVEVAGISVGTDNPTLNSSIYAHNAKIHFAATAGERVEVYNAVGQKIISTLAADGQNELSVNAKGVMIVKVGSRLAKVVL